MSINRVTRGERILEMMSKRGAITETGKDFLIAAVDPMHDKQLASLEGWPDVETSGSIVRCIKQSIPLASPFPTGNWDAQIFLWPWLEELPFDKHGRNNNTIQGNPLLGSQLFGGVQVFATQTDFSNLAGLGYKTVTLDPTYTSGASRVIGLGIEVTNTTASLYKQGQVTVYRQSQSHNEPSTYNLLPDSPATRIATSFSGQFIRRPPETLAEAMLIPGSRNWKAEDGCYLVAPFVGQDNPPCLVDYNQPVIYASTAGEDLTSPVGGNTVDLWIPVFNSNGATQPAGQFPVRLYDLHSPGCIFSGLSQQTTLTLTVNVYVETFPTPAERDILVLATPSAAYDPVALELFSQALGSLPVGVPADMNGLGDWFAGVVSDFSKMISPVATAIGGPMLGEVARGVGAVADHYRTPPTPQTRPAVRNKQKKPGPPPLPPRPVAQKKAMERARRTNRRKGKRAGARR